MGDRLGLLMPLLDRETTMRTLIDTEIGLVGASAPGTFVIAPGRRRSTA